MSRHRRRTPGRGARRRAIVAGAALVAVGVGAGIWLVGGDGAEPEGSRATRSPEVTPSPERSYPLSEEPRTIPAVRRHEPARGPGWRPRTGARVVVNDDALADEGRLLADELELDYAGRRDDRRDGDVRLEVGGGGEDDGPESYTLTVRDGRVTISAAADAGVFYGTRTLKQAVSGGATAPEGVVTDAPAKPRRGLMLDIARKPYPADWIEDRVRELGDLKFNELGLHFSDDQGFRIASETHPEVVSRDHLTKEQVERIVDLAAERHIEIVPELDSPGHLGAVLDAHPELRLLDAQGDPVRGAIDISLPESAALVDELLDEYASLFPGPHWHLGGDEYQALAVSDPETAYPRLAAAARERYGAGAGVADLATGWLDDRAATVRARDRVPRAWNDGFYRDTEVPAASDIRVAYWTGKEIGARQPEEYLDDGRDVVNYNDEFLYYVLGEPQTFVYPTGRRIYEGWTPRVLRGTEEVPARHDDRVLGAVFAVWGDIPDAQTADEVAEGIRLPLAATVQKLWDPDTPRLSWDDFRALAERLG
ncbi:glycoside hydrolase family 20 protein [Streptomyces sp. ZYX-F-203]